MGELRRELTSRILDLPEVEERRSRMGGGPAFFVGAREIAHFHGETAIDLRLGRAEIRALGAAPGLATAPRRNASHWLELRLRGECDVPRVVALVRRAARANRSPRLEREK
jgi:hypothetical protein